ncbi:GAF and ANTAR domain-containing protein [Jiangella alkaliphila]|uniref:GAF domain-containing protein n=1 Tax=Jiangella alkaliphila TaxID=419479 RepID=A0A1H2G355_9ACTN|nr:GAF and ANTAR domain-containing protein [Jiangella alkaliphila]SDU14034.1 GAF domain-containing protein [Jiangella alkaliphila]
MTDDGPQAGRDLTELLGAVHNLLLNSPRVEEFLTDLAKLAADLVEPPASCGITTSYDGRPRTVVSSDPRAAQVDEGQYTGGWGPCVHTLATGDPVEIADQESDERWPKYRVHAVALGVRSSLSLPLTVNREVIGAMNLYDFDQPEAFDAQNRHRAETFAAQASTALTLALRQAHDAELTDQLEQALATRSVIDQAVGILMAQQRCSADQAFGLLRKHSQNNNLKLRTVAERMVAKVSGQPAPRTAVFQRRPGGSMPEATPALDDGGMGGAGA